MTASLVTAPLLFAALPNQPNAEVSVFEVNEDGSIGGLAGIYTDATEESDAPNPVIVDNLGNFAAWIDPADDPSVFLQFGFAGNLVTIQVAVPGAGSIAIPADPDTLTYPESPSASTTLADLTAGTVDTTTPALSSYGFTQDQATNLLASHNDLVGDVANLTAFIIQIIGELGDIGIIELAQS